MLLSVWGYIELLLWCARMFSGWFKFTLSMMIYMAYCPVVISPLFYLMSFRAIAARRSGYEITFDCVAYAAMVAPACYYLAKSRLKELQAAGYFKGR